MSPRSFDPASPGAAKAVARMAVAAGEAIRENRLRRGWSIRELARRAGVSASVAQHLETGGVGSLEAYARLTTALDLRPELNAVDPRAKTASGRGPEDFVHAAMGELEARHFRSLGLPVAIDEPYQHYQFAGRADFLSWDLDRLALLHIENRTRFPNLQEVAGSFNAKRSYLAGELAVRWGLSRGAWASVTHVVVALWSAEVLHAVRLRPQSFRALGPDPATSFLSWWNSGLPTQGVASCFVLCDPRSKVRERYRFATLDDALRVRPRFRDYDDAATSLRG
jgi:transcriptional regulator with XRE-family HTH domain